MIIDLARQQTIQPDTGDAIEIERSPSFIAIAHKIRDHINVLPLNNEQHNNLVELITEQVSEGERTAFRQGFDMGVKLGKYFAERPELAKEKTLV